MNKGDLHSHNRRLVGWHYIKLEGVQDTVGHGEKDGNGGGRQMVRKAHAFWRERENAFSDAALPPCNGNLGHIAQEGNGAITIRYDTTTSTTTVQIANTSNPD